MGDEPLRASATFGELILHRPPMLTSGAIRRIHVYLDEQRVADLAQGDTTRVPAPPGPHLLRARCIPLISGDYPFVLGPCEALRAEVYVGALDEIEIHLCA